MTTTMPPCLCGHPCDRHGLGHPCKVPECGCRHYRGRRSDWAPARLRWTGTRLTECGRFRIQSERVRGEPVLHSLMTTALDRRRYQHLGIETSFSGPNAMRLVKEAAQLISDEYPEFEPGPPYVD